MSERRDGVVVLVERPELLERALTTLKKRTSGLRAELKRRAHYVPPSAKRQRKAARARARARKSAARQAAGLRAFWQGSAR